MRAKALVAALLVWPMTTLAAMDADGSGNYAKGASAVVTNVPNTMCCWMNADNTTSEQTVMSVTKQTAALDTYEIQARGDQPSDIIRARQFSSAASTGTNTSTGYTAGTWHHVCSVFASTTSRSAYIDGGSKTTDTTSLTTATDLTSTHLFQRYETSNPFDGRLAECGYWTAALTDDEVVTLARGFTPPCVRRGSLAAYYPAIRDTTSIKDLFTDPVNLTITGTVVPAAHPRIINCQ